MILTYENLLRFSDFKWRANPQLKALNIYNFLSFQDALHYLIKTYQWQNKTILLPAFYCDATIHDMKKHGLNVRLCKIDKKNFDVDLADFKSILKNEKIDIALIYNFFGKNSRLYSDSSWREYLQKDMVLISDFAHSLIPNHKIEFITEKHFYIDSTRKTTCRMMANLIMPTQYQLDNKYVTKFSAFKFTIRGLFFLKSWSLRIATRFNLNSCVDFGMWLYGLHDNAIGSRINAFTGFTWDKFLYHRIDFAKINQHRKSLQTCYISTLQNLVDQKHIELFPLTEQEAGNACFFFLRIINSQAIIPAITLLQKNGIWAEVLWNFDEISEMSLEDKAWAKSMIVLPYSLHTKPKHIQKIATLLEEYFNAK